jgi:cytochrome c2
VVVMILGSSSSALAAGDTAAGRRAFAARCGVCHATEAAVKAGPSLAGIARSKSGAVPGFDFSPAMKNADIT